MGSGRGGYHRGQISALGHLQPMGHAVQFCPKAAIRHGLPNYCQSFCRVSSSSQSNRVPPHLPAVRGGLLALTAAVLFGISTPLVQKLGAGVGAFMTAALLYSGAGLAGALLRQRVEREARVVSGDIRRLLAMAAAGAVIGPVALAWGLQRTSGTSASLMLTLEALFTAILAWRMYHESMDRRVWTAMFLLLAGAVLLVLDQARDGGARLWGLVAVLVATAAWDSTTPCHAHWRSATRARLSWPRQYWVPPLPHFSRWASVNRCRRQAQR